MLYHVKPEGITQTQKRDLSQGNILGVLLMDEVADFKDIFGISEKIIYDCMEGSASKFESYDGFDFITLNIPDDDLSGRTDRMCIYFQQGLLLFCCNRSPELTQLLPELQDPPQKNLSLDRVLYAYFDKLTLDDADILEEMEQEVSKLEEALITQKSSNYVSRIVSLRKRLAVLKKYYEQLLTIGGNLLENENKLIESKVLRYFRMLTNRCERLCGSVVTLRDYVSQVREAYQAQVDINLNSTMKLFTIISAIFLPLTLIVGWYGMNLQMPEFGWKYGYLVVILLSITVVAGTILFFKRKKWF